MCGSGCCGLPETSRTQQAILLNGKHCSRPLKCEVFFSTLWFVSHKVFISRKEKTNQNIFIYFYHSCGTCDADE